MLSSPHVTFLSLSIALTPLIPDLESPFTLWLPVEGEHSTTFYRVLPLSAIKKNTISGLSLLFP